MKIFIADDQAEVRLALKILLGQQEGIEIAGEASGPESLFSDIRGCRPGLLMLDWELGNIEASCLIPAIRCLFPGLLIVAMSVRPEARKAALEANVDAFVSKGDNSEKLLNVIDLICRR